jgi:hypothetical protein
MLPLDTLQKIMTASILSGTSTRLGRELGAGKADPFRQFAIYRNNSLISLTKALETNFPVTVRLVDERFFRWVAQDFIRRHPPCEARLSNYGGELPRFLARHPSCRGVPYVAEVARLEWSISTSLHRQELQPCLADALTGLGSEASAARLILQPTSDFIPTRWPAFDIWTAHQSETVELPSTITRKTSYVQVIRRDSRVLLTSLPAGRFAFRRGLARGSTLLAAVQRAISRDPLFAPATELALLFSESLVTRVLTNREGELS